MNEKIKQITSMIFIVFVDAVMITAAVIVSHFERISMNGLFDISVYTGEVGDYIFTGFIYIIALGVMLILGLYTKRNDFWMETKQIFKAVLYVYALIVAFVFLTKTSVDYSRLILLFIFLNMLFLIPLGRVMTKKFLSLAGFWLINVWVVGEGKQYNRMVKNLNLNWYLGYKIVDKTTFSKLVFIATEELSVKKLEDMIYTYRLAKKEVVIVPYLDNISLANADIIDLSIGRMSLISLKNKLDKLQNRVIKKIVELILVVIMVPVIVPVFILLYLLIKLDSRGSVFFVQERIGKDGRPFDCLKFRSMHIDGDGILESYLKEHPEEVDYYEHYHKYENDPRVTGIGKILRKLSLDELPQLINVIKGEMSLIGPRPYMPSEKGKIGKSLETILHVRPGITGLWQVSGRNEASFKERVQLDTWYIQNWSLWLDLIIFFKTFQVLISRRGAQ